MLPWIVFVDELYGDFEDLETGETHAAKRDMDEDSSEGGEESDGNEDNHDNQAAGIQEFLPLLSAALYNCCYRTRCKDISPV